MGITIFKTVAIFRIFDYLTLKAVESNVLRFLLPEGFQVVPKGEGYFVLLGKETPDFLKIESPIYEPFTINTWGEEEVVTVWLYQQMTSFSKKIAITGNEQEHYYAYRSNDMRLLNNKAEEDTTVSVFFERKIPIVGRKVLLWDGKNGDIVPVLGEENEGYRIENNNKSYRKIKTEVYVLFEGVIETGGTGVIVVPDDDVYQVIDEKGMKVN